MEISFPPIKSNDWDDHPLVIKAEIGSRLVHRMYVDTGSASEVLYEHCFNRLSPEVRNRMVPASASSLDSVESYPGL